MLSSEAAEDDGKFFFAKVESTQEEGILTFPAKPVEEQDGVSPAAWINYRSLAGGWRSWVITPGWRVT